MTLTAAVIGCGRGGTLSLDALASSGRYDLVAASDPAEVRRRQVQERWPGVRPFADHRALLEAAPVDVVCVATPTPSHAAVVGDLLDRGVRGLLIEKPIASDTTTARALLDELRARRLPAVVPHGLLVLPAARAVKRRVRRGDIGDMRSVEVQNSVDLLNAGIHWLVYLLDLFEGAAPRCVRGAFDVSGRAVNDGIRVESRGTTRIELDSGVPVTLHSGGLTAVTSEVLGPADIAGAVFRLTGSEGQIEFSAWANSYWIRSGEMGGEIIRHPLEGAVNYHQIMLEQLADHIDASRPDYRSASLSLRALEVIKSVWREQRSADWPLGEPAP